VDLKGHDKFLLRGFEVDPATRTISGPNGTRVVRASSMEILCLLADRFGFRTQADDLLRTVFPASGDPHGLLRACVEELRESLEDTGVPHSFIDLDEGRAYRLLARPEPIVHRHDDSADGWFEELKRRRVFRVLAAYAVFAWLCLQIVDVLSGALPVPDWTLTATTVALGAGFPVAALLSWVFQITPGGIVHDTTAGDGVSVNRNRLVHYVDLLIIGILLVVVVFLSYGRVFPLLSENDEVRVAVLPFENVSDDPENAYLGEGIADDIRARLYEIPQFLIAARSSSRSLARQGLDIRAIGERLGVNHVLEGTVRRAGKRFRLDVQLVDVDSGFSRWDKSYDASIEEVLHLQNRISLVVASELHVALTRETRESLARNATDDPVAFDLYLRAGNYLDRPRTAENLERARILFLEAIDYDPQFALGYAGLCRTEIARFRTTGDTQFVEPAQEHCRKALSLDTGLSEVHAALGELHTLGGKLEQAADAFNEAITIDPRAVDARSGLAGVLARQGRLQDAEAQHILAIELLPANWNGYNRFARFLLAQGRLDEALTNYERSIELAPEFAGGYNNIGVIYYFKGEFANAAEYYDKSIALNPGRAAYSNSGYMYYYAGNFEKAADMFSMAVKVAAADYRLWGNLADAQRFAEASKDIADASYAKALELVDLQLEIDPTDTVALSMRAWYLANLGEVDAIDAALDRVYAQDLNDSENLYVLALVHTLLGDTGSAEAALSKAIELGFSQVVLDATPEFQKQNRKQ
jgi:TolB-like protein/Flp pilus assembly protein TadD/DNA-binding winged helix-turn-helix (wHTH) protein